MLLRPLSVSQMIRQIYCCLNDPTNDDRRTGLIYQDGGWSYSFDVVEFFQAKFVASRIPGHAHDQGTAALGCAASPAQ